MNLKMFHWNRRRNDDGQYGKGKDFCVGPSMKDDDPLKVDEVFFLLNIMVVMPFLKHSI